MRKGPRLDAANAIPGDAQLFDDLSDCVGLSIALHAVAQLHDLLFQSG